MTEADLPTLREAVMGYIAEPRTKQEIVEMLARRHDVPAYVAKALIEDLARTKRISIAPGTSAKRWTTTVKARAAMSDQGDDGE